MPTNRLDEWLNAVLLALAEAGEEQDLSTFVDALLPRLGAAFRTAEAALELVHRHDAMTAQRAYWHAEGSAGDGVARVSSGATDPFWEELRHVVAPAPSTGQRTLRLGDGGLLITLSPRHADGGLYLGPPGRDDLLPEMPTPLLELLSLHITALFDRLLLERAADRDEVTGALSRQAVLRQLSAELERCARHELPLALALLEVDGLEDARIRHGQVAADRMLQEVARLFRAVLGARAWVGRHSGHQLLVVLPEASAANAHRALSGLCDSARNLEVDIGVGRRPSISLSMGLMAMEGNVQPEITDIEGLLAVADFALTRARQLGGDRIQHWSWSHVDAVDPQVSPADDEDPSRAGTNASSLGDEDAGG